MFGWFTVVQLALFLQAYIVEGIPDHASYKIPGFSLPAHYLSVSLNLRLAAAAERIAAEPDKVLSAEPLWKLLSIRRLYCCFPASGAGPF